MPAPTPNANIIIREHGGQPFYEAKFRHVGRQVKRRIGPAWLERDPTPALGFDVGAEYPMAPTTSAAR